MRAAQYAWKWGKRCGLIIGAAVLLAWGLEQTELTRGWKTLLSLPIGAVLGLIALRWIR